MIKNTLIYKNYYVDINRCNEQTKSDLLAIIDIDFLKATFEHTDHKSIQLHNVLDVFNTVYQLHLLDNLKIEQKELCGHCNNYFDAGSLKYVGNCDSYLCADCLKNHYKECEICGNIHLKSNLILFEGQMICKYCLRDKGYILANCKHCNTIYICKQGITDQQKKCYVIIA